MCDVTSVLWGDRSSVTIEYPAQITAAPAYHWSSVSSSFHWPIAGTCKAPLCATSQNLFHCSVLQRLNQQTQKNKPQLDPSPSAGSTAGFNFWDGWPQFLNLEASTQDREALNRVHTCHCSVRTYSWGHVSGITFQERKKPFLCFPFWQRRYTCMTKLKSMGVKHMLECFLEWGAQFLMWQWFVERIDGNVEGSILKVTLTAPM